MYMHSIYASAAIHYFPPTYVTNILATRIRIYIYIYIYIRIYIYIYIYIYTYIYNM